MMDLKHLINYLPFYYKEADSYKDNDGKGILEKFLEICGNYFLENIKEPTDNTLENLLKVDENTDYYYLDLIWYWFGEFPFIKPISSSILNLYPQQKFDILRYVISLYKIRGTENFYQILFKLYNNEENELKLVSIKQISPDWLNDFRDGTIPRTNVPSKRIWPYYDMGTFDEDLHLDEQQVLSFNGIVEFNVTVNENLGDMKKIWKFIKNFIDRFLPFNVISKLLLNGKNYDETSYHFNVYTFNGSKWVRRESGTTLSLDPDEDLRVKIELLDNYNRKVKDIPWYGDLIYTVGKDPNKDPNYVKGMSEKSRYYGERYLNINSVYRPSDVGEVKKVSNTYRFYLDDPNKAFTLIISNDKYQNITYYIIKIGEYDKVYDGENPISVPVEAYKVDGNNKLPVHVVSEHSGEVKESQSTNQFITTWDITAGGTYKFHIEEDPSKIVEAVIANRKPGYKVLLGYKYVKRTYYSNTHPSETTIDKLEDKLSKVVMDTQIDLLKDAQVKIYIESLNNQPVPDNLTVTIKGTNIHLKNGDTWKPLSMDNYIFSVDQGNPDLNKSASLEIIDKSIQVQFIRYWNLHTRDYIDDQSNQTGLVLAYVGNNKYSQDFLNNQDNSSYIVTTPDGKTYKIGTREGETPKVDGQGFVIDRIPDVGSSTKFRLRITTRIAGLFYIQSPFTDEASFKWYVIDNRSTKPHISYLEITPIGKKSNNDYWTGKNRPDANTFGITFTRSSPVTEPFLLRLVDDQGNTVQDSSEEVIMETVRMDGKNITEKVDLGKVLTAEGVTTFKANLKDGRTLVAKLNWLHVTILPPYITWVTNEFGLLDKSEKPLLIDTMGNDNLTWSIEKYQD